MDIVTEGMEDYLPLLVQKATESKIDELNAKFNLKIPAGDYTTIAGFIIDKLGKIPRPNDYLETDFCKFIVKKATRKKVLEVKIIKKKIKTE